MPYPENIQKLIQQQADRLIKRHELYCRVIDDEINRRKRRSTSSHSKTIHVPDSWALAEGFNPYITRSRSARIAHAIKAKFRAGLYAPRTAAVREIPKPSGGGVRKVQEFQIADSAVSAMLFWSLLAKNYQQFSKYSYAYRRDLSVHDSIRHLRHALSQSPGMVVAQVDYSSFFDNIKHGHIRQVLEENDFLVAAEERAGIEAFLSSSSLGYNNYSEFGGIPRPIGVPQGTSISLFLANVAATPLDLALESLPVGFARYGDDTVIWSRDYGKVTEAVGLLAQQGKSMGVKLDLEKSEGIFLFAPVLPPAEIADKQAIEFVGYALHKQPSGSVITSMHERAIRGIRNKISRLISQNLLADLRSGTYGTTRVLQAYDRDYTVLAMQLRRYLYGDMTDRQLRRYLGGYSPKIRYQGRMSFYPLVNDFELLKSLDGWLLHAVHQALQKKTQLLAQQGITVTAVPHGYTKQRLAALRGDQSLPSFYRIGKILEQSSSQHGANSIANRKSFSFNSS
jgi:RNA-directed DNA polymerase